MQDFKPTDTIKVVADTTLGFMIIDASDFDEAEHQIYEEPKPKTEKPKADPPKV